MTGAFAQSLANLARTRSRRRYRFGRHVLRSAPERTRLAARPAATLRRPTRRPRSPRSPGVTVRGLVDGPRSAREYGATSKRSWPENDGRSLPSHFNSVSPGFFRTLGIPVARRPRVHRADSTGAHERRHRQSSAAAERLGLAPTMSSGDGSDSGRRRSHYRARRRRYARSSRCEAGSRRRASRRDVCPPGCELRSTFAARGRPKSCVSAIRETVAARSGLTGADHETCDDGAAASARISRHRALRCRGGRHGVRRARDRLAALVSTACSRSPSHSAHARSACAWRSVRRRAAHRQDGARQVAGMAVHRHRARRACAACVPRPCGTEPAVRRRGRRPARAGGGRRRLLTPPSRSARRTFRLGARRASSPMSVLRYRIIQEAPESRRYSTVGEPSSRQRSPGTLKLTFVVHDEEVRSSATRVRGDPQVVRADGCPMHAEAAP